MKIEVHARIEGCFFFSSLNNIEIQDAHYKDSDDLNQSPSKEAKA